MYHCISFPIFDVAISKFDKLNLTQHVSHAGDSSIIGKRWVMCYHHSCFVSINLHHIWCQMRIVYISLQSALVTLFDHCWGQIVLNLKLRRKLFQTFPHAEGEGHTLKVAVISIIDNIMNSRAVNIIINYFVEVMHKKCAVGRRCSSPQDHHNNVE